MGKIVKEKAERDVPPVKTPLECCRDALLVRLQCYFKGKNPHGFKDSGKHCLALRRKVAFLHRQNTCKGLFCSGKCAVPAEKERGETSLLQNLIMHLVIF